MSLLELAPGLFSFPSAVNSFVVEDGHGGALLVDTGLDDSHARKLLRAVEEAGLKPVAILNTHSHADHHGRNAFLLKKCPDLPVYAPPVEAAIIGHPLLKPLALYGASPLPELRSKFLLAPSSPARPIQGGLQRIAGVEVELIGIPGHALDMYAVRVGDVLYAADGLFGPDSLTKHPLTFCADSAQQKESARKLGELDGVRVVLPGHGEPTGELRELAALNVAAYERITQLVLAAVHSGEASIDHLLARVCAALGIDMGNAGAVVLNRAVVSAHLTELVTRGQARAVVSRNQLLFRAES